VCETARETDHDNRSHQFFSGTALEIVIFSAKNPQLMTPQFPKFSDKIWHSY